MKFSIPRMLLLSVSLSSILLVPALHAQTSTAQLSGSVADSSGAVLPHANVLIVNRDTGISRPVQTDGQGQYSAPALEPGHYRITVEAKGFQTLVTDNVTLNVAQNANLGFQLKVGAENQTVTVDGSGQMINTTDASVGTVIDRKFVENIPLNGRSFQDLISMTPGVITASPQSSNQNGQTGDFSVNGQRTESNYYIVDGVSGNINPGNGTAGSGGNGTIAAATALGTTQSLISVDALQEFRVESSTYSAEYGHGPGGQFSFATRSGTNKPHGTAFDYLRNSYFDANNWFNDELGQPKAALRQNDFGGTFGAPIRIPWIYNGTDKTFFFVSYEGLRLSQPQAASIQYVPDTALRFSAAPALQPLLNAFPVQNGAEDLVRCTVGATSTYPCPTGSPAGTLVQSGLADFSESYSLPAMIDSTSVRIDHTFGPKLALFFRFGGTPSSISSRNLSQFTQTHVNAYTYTFGATSQFSSKTTNDFRLGYASTDAVVNYTLDSFGGAVPVNETSAVGLAGYQNPAAVFYLQFSGVGTTYLEDDPGSTRARTWNAVDSVNTLIGRHRIKVGFDFLRFKSIRNSSSHLVEPFYYSPGELETNQAMEIFAEQFVNSAPVFSNTAVFVQDDWQVRPRFSLSLGLRWEIDPAPHNADGDDAYTLIGNLSDPSTLALAPRGTALWHTYWHNFAPRVGGAWSLHQERGKETVLRAGAGVFFDTYNEPGAAGFNGLGFFADQAYFSAPLPVTPAQVNVPTAAIPPYNNVYAFSPHLQVPYTLQWNVSLEQALGVNQTFTTSYIGANGRRLISAQIESLAALNPTFGDIYTYPGNITSNYQALQAKFQRTVSHGVQALVSYTWSHSIDFGSTYALYGLIRGNSDFDVRHNLSAGASWELPGTSRNRILDEVIDHWGIDARFMVRTGFPVPLFGNELSDPATGTYYFSGVNLVPGKPLYLYGRQYPGGRALNGGPGVAASSAALTLPTGTSEGNEPRNVVRGFGENQINLAVRRSFPIRDKVSLQFRAEAFNILNHPNFGAIDNYLTDAQFGLATQTLNQSLATLGSQYQQGGPRSMQFALKLVF